MSEPPDRYARDYDRRHKTNPLQLRVGQKVQYRT